jgi:hypothetical protein
MAVAAVTAAALMALIGAGTASATVLCAESGTTSTACTVGTHTKEFSGTIQAEASNPKLDTNIAVVTCEKSNTTLSASASTGTPAIAGTVTALSFTGNCMLEGTTTTCTVTTEGLPYNASIEHTAGESSILTVTSGTGGGNPRAHVKCGSLINCTFGKSSVTLAGTNGSPTQFVANIALNRESGICPETSTWTATYSVTSPVGFTIH